MFEQFYGLASRPFQLTPDPDFYFESATHRKALSYLGYGLAQGEGFIVITGEVGAGKSTLVAHLTQRIDAEQLTLAQIVTSRLDGEELVHLAARAFGLEVDGHDKATALGQIERFLQDEAREGRRCLLVVDESQNLSIEAIEELRMLSNFQLGSHPLLQILLLGQPEFRDLLDSSDALEQLRQRVIARHHLDAMGVDEIEPYVTHRLECAGWGGDPSFEAGTFEAVHEATGSIPRKVNQLMTRVLLLGAVEQKHAIGADMVRTVSAELAQASAAEERPHPDASDHPVSDTGSPAPGPDVAAMFGARDAQITELQQAVVELSEALANTSDDRPHDDALAAIDARLAEQEQTVRYMLTMLVEWLEAEAPRQAA